MAEWHYGIAPDLRFIVRTARAEPELLSRTFGPVIEAGDDTGNASLVLDLAARASGADARPEHAEGGRTIRGTYKGLRWGCVVSRTEEDGWTFAFQSWGMREYLAMHIALLPALRFLMTRRKSALILGAAYDEGGSATVISGPTGTGKTSLLLAALARGARFIGDEYLGVDSAGQASPVVRSLALRRSTLDLAPDAGHRLSGSRRLTLRLAELATSLTRGRLEPLSHLRPETLGMKVTQGPVPVKRFVWLEQVSDGTAARVSLMPREDVVRELSLRQTVHQSAYDDITPVLESVGGGKDIESEWRGALADGLAHAECHRIQFAPDGLSDASDCLEQLGQQ